MLEIISTTLSESEVCDSETQKVIVVDMSFAIKRTSFWNVALVAAHIELI